MKLIKCTFTFEIFEKNTYLYICGTDFLEIFRENKKLVPRIPFILSDAVFALPRPPEIFF